MGLIAWQSQGVAGLDHGTLLTTLISGEEIIEGPLDPSAYAQTSGPGIGGARLAAINAADTGLNLITFEDPEVEFAQTLGGTAALAVPQTLVPEPGSDPETESRFSKPQIYTIQEGDTIAGIAAKFDVSVNTVLWANGLGTRSTIKTSDHLTILPTTGVLHTVQSGDTVLALAEKYDAKASDIMEYNDLDENASLKIGQKLVVPDGYIEPQVSTPKVVPDSSRIADGPTPPPVSSQGSGLIWPTASRHIAQYFRWGHTGIDIDNRAHPPVYAATDGVVEFAGWLGGYGNLLIVNHGNGLSTYYGHLDAFYAGEGQTVTKGAAIGKMGSTGRSSGPHVHFEVRRNGQPINPLGMY